MKPQNTPLLNFVQYFYTVIIHTTPIPINLWSMHFLESIVFFANGL